ncbi:porphobilinogen synthase [Planctomycetota bacterium]
MADIVNRPRRLRQSDSIRRLMRETQVHVDDFVMPLFVDETIDRREEVPSMPGIFRLALDEVAVEAEEIAGLGIPAVMLFGIPAHKDENASGAWAADGIIQQAIGKIKAAVPALTVIADVCNCEYTSHGHCGVLEKDRHGRMDVHNDKTLDLLCKTAVSCAVAGVDMVAPSDMMDGRVEAIRAQLDVDGFEHVPIMAYSVKYASAFYGPFRDAVASTPEQGDRKSYQMDPPNIREALKEAALDLQEGADILMVKPALAYLDVIRAIHEEFDAPVAAYNVSGEYAVVKAAAGNKWIDEKAMVMEILTAIKRAGADIIITYFAKDAARLLG